MENVLKIQKSFFGKSWKIVWNFLDLWMKIDDNIHIRSREQKQARG